MSRVTFYNTSTKNINMKKNYIEYFIPLGI